jgi:hypothetical protein
MTDLATDTTHFFEVGEVGEVGSGRLCREHRLRCDC